MTLDKKQVPQLIVLGVLAVLCVGVVSFQVMKGKTAPHAPVAANSAKTDTSEEQNASSVDVSSMNTTEFPNLAALPDRRDPFAPQGISEAAAPTTIDATQSARRVQPARQVRHASGPARSFSIPSGNVPSIDVKPINPFSQGNAPADVSSVRVQPVIEKGPQFVLTGVIRGDRNVAIIRVGNDGRHVVKTGQTIDGHYRVLSVSDDGAVLVNEKNRRIHVRLGGDKNAG